MKLWVFLAAAALAHAQATFSGSPLLDEQVEQSIREGLIPGAVLIVGHNGKIVHRRAYGQRALIPSREAMTIDTIFDIASLTKVVATTPAVMKLYEQGKIDIGAPVTKYLPEFQAGMSAITIGDLLTHFSGLKPDVVLEPPWSGYQTGVRRALLEKPEAPRGTRFVYSDINFVLLAEIVHRVSGKMLDEFANEEMFSPLGMQDTTFNPPASKRSRIAPTEIDPASGQPFRGIVHDPTSRYMGGVTGDAGVFSTASDLVRFAQMMANLGELEGVRIFAPATVKKFTSPASPPGLPNVRGLGWDIDSSYSAPRGEIYSTGSFGHTGFTGTSMWIDPASNSYVILLTNAVHPNRGKVLAPLRRSVATIVAAAVGAGQTAANHHVLTGLDVLEEQKFESLKGKRIGLITNQTGLDRQGRRNVDMMKAAGVNVVALFSPEHGLAGKEDRPDIRDTKDAATGLPVYSLYEPNRRRLTPEQFRQLDTLVFDIQDVGARFFTYSCTMLYALEDAGKAKVPFVVLDRPNPITGVHLEGPLADENLQSFVGCYDMPVRHGLTMGELATMANAERKWSAQLTVVKMKNWDRADWFDSTGLPWVDLSPNLRSLTAAILYPGIALLESSKNYSVGRGTETPFEQIGADWIHGPEFALYLNARQIPGVRAYATHFRPEDSNFKGKTIEGVHFIVINRDQFNAVEFGLELASALDHLYPGKIDLEQNKSLIANRKVLVELKSHQEAKTIVKRLSEEDLEKFESRRRPYLAY
jgi:uncharacterized protein YbbC (DUF1343 family)/CubicO group peptidase (beta-lactamase class C family)